MRKIKVLILLLLMLAGISVTAFASLPSEKMLIIGNKAYLYSDITSKQDEINRQIFNNPTAIYYKDGTSIRDVFTNNIVQESMLYYTCGSQITYYYGYNSAIYLYDSSGTYNAVSGTGSAFATVDMTVTKVTDNLSLASVKLTSVSGIPGAAYFKVYDVSRDIKGINDTISTSFVNNPLTVNIYVYKSGDTATPVASGVVNMPASTGYTNNIARVVSNIALTSSDILLPRTDLGQGNIVNGGYISSDDQYIYYSNTADGGKIYRRSLSGLDDYPICDDNAKYLNVVRGWIYYSNYSDKGKIYKVRTDGSQKQKLSDNIGIYLNVIGDNVYYSNRTDKGRIYVLNSNGISQPLSTDEADYLNISGSSTLFYRNVSDSGRLYKMNLDGSYRQLANMNSAKYVNANISSMVYYTTDDGKIYRYGDLYPLNLKLVTKDAKGNNSLPVDDMATNINVVGNTIYYKSVKDGGKLYKVGTNGGVGEKVADVPVDTISVYTSSGVDTVFFTSNGKLYQVMAPIATTDKNGVVTNKLVAAAVAKPKSTLKVSSVDNISVTVDDTDVGKTIDQIDLNKYIPNKVPAMMSDGTIRQLVVFWDMSKATAKNGVYVYSGTLVGYGKAVSLTLSLSSTGINPTYVNVINNIGKNDIVQTLDNSGLVSGDIFKVYDSSTAAKPLAQQIADSSGHVVIVGLDLNKNGGTIYVTVTKSGQAESKRIIVPYGIEIPPAPVGIGLDLSGVVTSPSDPNAISKVQVTTLDSNATPLASLQYKTEKINGDGSKNTVTDWTALTVDSSGKAFVNVTQGVGGAQIIFRKTGTTSVPDSAPTNPIMIAPRGVAPVGIGFDEQSSTTYSGKDKILISGTTSLMEYSVDNGVNWSKCSLGSTLLDNQNPGTIARVRTKATKLSLPSLETVQIKITNPDGIYSISSIAGTLVLQTPADVTWTVTDEDKAIGTPTTKATINATSSRQATVTAVENGRVKVWATATDGTGLNGYVIITIGAQKIVTVEDDIQLAAALINPSVDTIKLMQRVYNMDNYTVSRPLTIIGQGNTSQIKIKSTDSNGNFINANKSFTLKNLVIDGNAKNVARVINASLSTGSSLSIDGFSLSNIKNSGSTCDGIYIYKSAADIKNSNFDSTNAINHAVYVDNDNQNINLVNNTFAANSNSLVGYEYGYYQVNGTGTNNLKGNFFRGYNHYDTAKTPALANADAALVIASGNATIGGVARSESNAFDSNVMSIVALDDAIVNGVTVDASSSANTDASLAALQSALLDGWNSINHDVLYGETLRNISIFGTTSAAPVITMANQTVGSGANVTINTTVKGTAYLIPNSTPASACDTQLELDNMVNASTFTKTPVASTGTINNITAPTRNGIYSLVFVDDSGNVTSKTMTTVTVDAVAPVLNNIVVNNANQNEIVLTYNETLDNTSIPSAADFNVTVNGAPIANPITKINISGNSVMIDFTNPFTSGQNITLSYTKGTNYIRDPYRNRVLDLVNYIVTNNVIALDPPTVFADTSLNDTENAIDITFNNGSAWKSKITSVKDNGVDLFTTQYTTQYDNSLNSGKITIIAGALVPGSHNITISAAGYSDANIVQVVNYPPGTISVSAVTMSDNKIGAGQTGVVLSDLFKIAVGTEAVKLTNVKIGVSGTTSGAISFVNLDNLKLMYSTDAVIDLSDVQLGTPQNPTNGATEIIFGNLSQTVAVGSGYLYVIGDINSQASDGQDFTLSIGAGKITAEGVLSKNTNIVSTSSASGTKVTIDKTPPTLSFNSSLGVTNVVLNSSESLGYADGTDIKSNFALTQSGGTATTASITSAIYDATAKTITFTIAAGDISNGGELNVISTLLDSNGQAIVPAKVSTYDGTATKWK